MFNKTGAIFTIANSSRIKTASSWENYITSHEKQSVAQGIKVHRLNNNTDVQKIVCDIDLNKYIYIHTTIMASVDVDPGSEHYISKDTEKYINNNGDAWTRN